MKYSLSIVLIVFSAFSIKAQINAVDSFVDQEDKELKVDSTQIEAHRVTQIKLKKVTIDSAFIETATRIDLDKVLIVSPFKFKSREDRLQYLILRRKTIKVWPYAVMASSRLTELRNRLDSLDSRRAKRKYTKIVQKYLEGKFKERLKNLTKTEGQILVKLMYRQTGETTYDVVKDLRSGTRAFFYNITAGLFTISLKEKFDPLNDKDDYYIEHILRMSFQHNQLKYQPAAIDIDYQKITEKWSTK